MTTTVNEQQQHAKQSMPAAVTAVLESPETSSWLHHALISAMERDPVDAARDANLLVGLLTDWVHAALETVDAVAEGAAPAGYLRQGNRIEYQRGWGDYGYGRITNYDQTRESVTLIDEDDGTEWSGPADLTSEA